MRTIRSAPLLLAAVVLATGCIVQPAGDADGHGVGAEVDGHTAPTGTEVVPKGAPSGGTSTGESGVSSVGVAPPPMTAGPTPDPWRIGADPSGAGPTPDPWDPGRARSSGSTAGSTTTKAGGTKSSK